MQSPLVKAAVASGTNEKQLNELVDAADITLTDNDIMLLNNSGK